ncbi:hypothetical protein THOM_2533 [Trachipleistophora hominis]|uniref:Uncharacterized protein n=1 Tax=Trachipleistophora hominis TaxID=72359 RepID=L7JT14_TRAHO|nr:hypothetical protein THOM_2533 [Trachipleistophora hominis]
MTLTENTNKLDDKKMFDEFKAMQNEYHKLYLSYFSEGKRYDDVNETNIYQSSIFMIDMVLQCCLNFRECTSFYSSILKSAKTFLVAYTCELEKSFDKKKRENNVEAQNNKCIVYSKQPDIKKKINVTYNGKRAEMENIFNKFHRRNEQKVEEKVVMDNSPLSTQTEVKISAENFDESINSILQGCSAVKKAFEIGEPEIASEKQELFLQDNNFIDDADVQNEIKDTENTQFENIIVNKTNDMIDLSDDLFQSLGIDFATPGNANDTSAIPINRLSNQRNKKRYRFNTNTNQNKRKKNDHTPNNTRQQQKQQHCSLSKSFFNNLHHNKSQDNQAAVNTGSAVTNNSKNIENNASFAARINNLCVKHKISHPEYVIERTNNVYICTAEFFSQKFTSRYFKTKEEAKNDVCRLICAFLEPAKDNIGKYYEEFILGGKNRQ